MSRSGALSGPATATVTELIADGRRQELTMKWVVIVLQILGGLAKVITRRKCKEKKPNE